MAIRGDRIVAVGTEADVREAVGAGGEHLHLPGRMVVPGFQDAHIHAAFGARNLLNVNLDDLADRDAYLERIRAFAEANPDLPWIVGGGWYSPVFGDAGPRASDLDAVVPDRPVFLLNTDVHAGWVNTRTLELAGWNADTPDPFDGYFVRDPDGSPTGCLQEGTAYTVLRELVPAPSVEEWKTCLRRAQQHLTALGITGWQDAWVEPDLLTAYRELDDAGELAVRVVASLWWDRHQGMEQVDGLLAGRERGTGGRVNAGTVKIMLDGCPESATGAMLEPYEGAYGEAHGTGIVFVDDEMLREAVMRLDAEGFQIHQHALGDRAIRSALDAIQSARHMNGMNDHRHHVAHLQLPDPADIPRLRAARRDREHPAVLGAARPRDREPDAPARRSAGGAAVSDRVAARERRGRRVRERLAGHDPQRDARARRGREPRVAPGSRPRRPAPAISGSTWSRRSRRSRAAART